MCRSRRELPQEYTLAKFGFDTAENEPYEVCPLSVCLLGNIFEQLIFHLRPSPDHYDDYYYYLLLLQIPQVLAPRRRAGPREPARDVLRGADGPGHRVVR